MMFRHLGVALLTLALTTTAMAQAKTSKHAFPRAAARQALLAPAGAWPLYDQIVARLPHLPGPQKIALQEKNIERTQALEDFATEVRQRSRILGEQTRDPSLDPAARAKAQSLLQRLPAERTTLLAKLDAELLALLTSDQRAQLYGPGLAEQVLARLAGADLTPQQHEKILALAKDMSRDFTAPLNPDGTPKVLGRLYKRVVSEILTEEQLGKFVTVAATPARPVVLTPSAAPAPTSPKPTPTIPPAAHPPLAPH